MNQNKPKETKRNQSNLRAPTREGETQTGSTNTKLKHGSAVKPNRRDPAEAWISREPQATREKPSQATARSRSNKLTAKPSNNA